MGGVNAIGAEYALLARLRGQKLKGLGMLLVGNVINRVRAIPDLQSLVPLDK